MPMQIAIIGAGHNGLVCAVYLARAGHKVTVFEKNEKPGGLCITEPIFPGFNVSTVSSYFGMFRDEVINDLGLEEVYDHVRGIDSPSITLLPDGESIVSRPGVDADQFSFDLKEEDRAGWCKFWHEVNVAGVAIGPYLTRIGVTQYELQKVLESEGFIGLGSRLFDGTLLDIIDSYFSDPLLRAAACATSWELPTRKGTIFGCIYGATTSVNGRNNTSAYLKGGMGVLTDLLVREALAAGVEIRTNSPVRSIMTKDRAVSGVKLMDGTEFEAQSVVSNLDPRATFGNLLEEKLVPMGIRTHLKTPIPPVSSAKVHFALSEMPVFPVLESIEGAYSGKILITPSIEKIIQSADDAIAGKLPEEPVLSLCFASQLDETAAPPGKQLLSVDFHYVPVTNEADRWNDENAQLIVDRAVKTIEKHAPGFVSTIEASTVVSPGHLQSRFGIVTGHGSHLPMTAEYLVERRRMPYCGQHTTPITKLYMCGAGSYPGSGVSGAPGRICAKTILSIIKQKREML